MPCKNFPDLNEIISRQENFFRSGATQDICFRTDALSKLRGVIRKYDDELCEAFRLDLGKHPFESYASEHGLALQEIGIMLRNLRKWARAKRAYTPLIHWFARSYFRYQPYGRVLIISPWNYPFQLLFMPLIGAVASGNCVLAKPSRHAGNTSMVMKKIASESFEPEHVFLVEGGSEINGFLLEQRFDYIFFTGSIAVGKKIMGAASRHLTPVSLELGGKSPVIVEPDASPSLAAKRILWGKLLNAGQSCVAPDFVLVHRDIRERLLREMTAYLQKVYGDDIRSNGDYARIINESTARKLASMIEGKDILIGGEVDTEQKYISPTVIGITDPEAYYFRHPVRFRGHQ